MTQTLILALSGVTLLTLATVWRWPQVRGTTLLAPWVWGSVSIVTLAATELAIALAPAPAWSASLRYVAAISTFCPIIALLGAKRPQDRGWQWIVLSIWPILSQPGIEWLLFGGVAEIHPARFWFMMILVAVGATNGLGTRNWLASLLFAAGQIMLLLPFFSPGLLAAPVAALLGFAGIVGWSVWVTLVGRTDRRVIGHRLDRAWLDFRDEFGVVWALRIRERMTTSAAMYDWPVTLAWQGFEPRESATYDATPRVVEDSFRTLLRRFVSPAWIDERVAAEQNSAVDHAPPVTASTE